MEIIKTNIDQNNKKLVYKLTKASGLMIQDTPEDADIDVKYWGIYNDPKESKKDGEIVMKDQRVLSIIDEGGNKFSTVSDTFMREFGDIVEIMQDEPFSVLIKHGTTKAGKPFVTCELDCEGV